MATLIFSVGISGSGKSRLYDKSLKDFGCALVCPDDIRQNIFGSINDQSNNAKVFQIANEQIISFLKKGDDVYFSATNLKATDVIGLLNNVYSEIKNNFFVQFCILTDSFKPNLCYQRIKDDLKNGIDRANVPEEVIQKQAKRFETMIKNIESGLVKQWLDDKNISFKINYI